MQRRLTSDDHLWVVDPARSSESVPEGSTVAVRLEDLFHRHFQSFQSADSPISITEKQTAFVPFWLARRAFDTGRLTNCSIVFDAGLDEKQHNNLERERGRRAGLCALLAPTYSSRVELQRENCCRRSVRRSLIIICADQLARQGFISLSKCAFCTPWRCCSTLLHDFRVLGDLRWQSRVAHVCRTMCAHALGLKR